MISHSDPLARVQARRYLEELNHHILMDEGEIVELPGKISLVWTPRGSQYQRFLAVKSAGETEININGRRYPATVDGVKKGLLEAYSQNR
jgi:hypothetical protein